MYTEQSYEAIKQRMLDSLKYDIDKREGTFINDIYSPISVEFAKAYMEMDNVHSVMFVEDAYEDDLDKQVNEFGVPRKMGEKATGTLTFKGVDDVLVPRNMSVFTDGGFEYVTTSQGYIKDGVINIEVEAKNVGAIYNIEPNTVWKIPNEVIVFEITNNNNFEGGIDIETDEDLKERFFEAVRNVRTSGNVNDYKYWAKEIDGVYNVEVYPLWSGNGTVKVVASKENRLPLDEETLESCETHINNNAPIGATVTVITTSLFDVNINADVTVSEGFDKSSVKLAIEEAIKTYIGTCVDKIYYNKIGAMILGVEGVIDYTSLTVNSGTSSSISIPSDNVANVQSINVNVGE